MKIYQITDPEIKLAEHQIKAVNFILTRKASIINYETGTGKTFICLESVFRLIEKRELEKALVVCTKSSVLSFEGDIKSTNYPSKNLIIIKKNEDLELVSKANNAIFIIQYETLLSINLREVMREFKAFKSGLFIDEVHRVKTFGKFTKGGKDKQSQTAASLGALKRSFIYLVGLSATLITSELEDGYRVINFISPGTLGGWKWFQENFCVYQECRRWNKKLRKHTTYPKLMRYKNLEKFNKYIENVVIKFFPKLDYRFHVLCKSLKKGSKRALKYEELAMSSHEKGFDKHSSIAPRLQRLIDKSPAKRFLLQTVARRCFDQGLIVYSRTRKGEMLEYIQEILEEEGYEVRVVSGSTKKEERQKVIDWAFKGSPKGKCVLGTSAMGQSLNLQWTCNLCYFELPNGPGQYLQVKGRIGRMFSKWKTYHFWFIMVKDTIDEYWYLKMCSNKEMIGNTSSDIAIPKSKINKFNERQLKKERNAKIWRKDAIHGKKFENSDKDSVTTKIGKRVNGKNIIQ